MNILDKKLYIRLFVDFIKDDKKVTPDDSEVEYILTKIPDSFMDSFEYWLRSKANEIEDEDEWDKWYETVQFEDLDEDEIKSHYLPTKKKVIVYNWETELALKIYKLAKEFVEAAKALPLYDANLVVGYKFNNYGMEVYYYAPKKVQLNKACSKNGYNLQVRKQVYELYKQYFAGSNGSDSYLGEAQKLLKNKYKTVMKENNIFIGENTTEVSSKDSVNDADYYTGRWWGISYYEVTSPDEDFLHRFFEYVNDSYESQHRPEA